jgi:hypothetical protein
MIYREPGFLSVFRFVLLLPANVQLSKLPAETLFCSALLLPANIKLNKLLMFSLAAANQYPVEQAFYRDSSLLKSKLHKPFLRHFFLSFFQTVVSDVQATPTSVIKFLFLECSLIKSDDPTSDFS